MGLKNAKACAMGTTGMSANDERRLGRGRCRILQKVQRLPAMYRTDLWPKCLSLPGHYRAATLRIVSWALACVADNMLDTDFRSPTPQFLLDYGGRARMPEDDPRHMSWDGSTMRCVPARPRLPHANALSRNGTARSPRGQSSLAYAAHVSDAGWVHPFSQIHPVCTEGLAANHEGALGSRQCSISQR